MEMKVYLASQENKTVGVRLDMSARKAKKIEYTHDGSETKISCLEAIISEMTKVEVKDLDVPVQFFINSFTYNTIQNGYYKYWLLTGKNSEGEVISEDELALWEAFNNLMTEKGLYLIFKNAFAAKIDAKRNRNKKAKITAIDKANDKYISYSWEQLKKLVGESPEVEDDFADVE